MERVLILLLTTAAARPKVLDVPLQSSGTGTICGNYTCSYCCLEGYVCATYMPDCAYISNENYTERIIFIVFGAFFGLWVALWVATSVWNFIKSRRRLNTK